MANASISGALRKVRIERSYICAVPCYVVGSLPCILCDYVHGYDRETHAHDGDDHGQVFLFGAQPLAHINTFCFGVVKRGVK